MKGVVTNRQIFFLLLLIITGYSLISLPKDAFQASQTGAWFTILLLTLVFAAGVFIITRLSRMFQGQSIAEYAAVLVGKKASKMITGLYAIYFTFVSALLFRSVGEFIKTCFLPETPVWILQMLLIALSFYIASKGITNIGRMCELFGIFFILAPLPTHFLMLQKGNVNHILPLFEPDRITEYVAGCKDLIVPFLGIEVLTIIPFGKINNKRGVATAMWTMLYIGLFYILMVESTVMIIGRNNVLFYDDTILEALRITPLPKTLLLERADFLFLIIGLWGIFSGTSAVAYASVEFTLKTIKYKKRNALILYFGVSLFLVSNFALTPELTKLLFRDVLPYPGVLMAFVIPIVLFIIAKIRSRVKVERVQHADAEG